MVKKKGFRGAVPYGKVKEEKIEPKILDNTQQLNLIEIKPKEPRYMMQPTTEFNANIDQFSRTQTVEGAKVSL